MLGLSSLQLHRSLSLPGHIDNRSDTSAWILGYSRSQWRRMLSQSPHTLGREAGYIPPSFPLLALECLCMWSMVLKSTKSPPVEHAGLKKPWDWNYMRTRGIYMLEMLYMIVYYM